MRHIRFGLAAVLAVALGVSAVPGRAQFQEDGERSAQAKLPQGKSAIWATLRQTRIGVNEAKGLFTATHPPAVKALAGQSISLAGFIMPLDAETRGTHFLLSKYTPVCAFCPPGEPNEVVEVHSAKPIAFVEQLVIVTGKFALENKGENGLFFQMTGASVR